ncbi:MAG: 50S ribosomal protein L24, partial [Planktotalea sp.]|uniref:50S ribosomal protein L24 n=1 Tax=Planktotalea sp. TaxID=2029877 RepID=UPI002615E391
MAAKLKKGDKVVVLAGKDKGKEGTISSVDPKTGKAIVDGINIAKRHQKPTSATDQGGIIDKAMPLHVSNVAILSPSDGKPTRIGYRFTETGDKDVVEHAALVEIL